ncbi:MAG: DUF484 family protein [Rhodospirillales bacterium]|nr:DUF484 family protein [Rhodospirillales bacterium]
MNKDNENRSQAALAEDEAGHDDGLSDTQVIAYLQRHPEFFTQRAGLLQAMVPPARWSGDTVVDMQRFMVESLRDEIAGLRDCANEVIETSRANLAIQGRTHAAALALVAAPDLDSLVRTVTDDLPIVLDVDVAVLNVEPAPGLELMIGGIGRLRGGDVDRFVGAGRDVALYREMADDGTIFGAAAGLVGSAALARVRWSEDAPPALLAFGCRDDGAFHPRQGTELLRFLAKVLEACLVRLLPIPA